MVKKMIETNRFKEWLSKNTEYSDAAVNDIVSRMKRADRMLPWEPTKVYLFHLEQQDEFGRLSVSVKSQIRRAVRLYSDFIQLTIR